MKTGLGKIERQFFAYIQMRGQSTVRTGELRSPLQLSAPRERRLLSRLAKAGMIARVRRGLYLVPLKLPLGGIWTPNEILALNTLMANWNARYQICGPNAFNRYGFDEQIPNRVYAYNNRLSGERTIGKAAFTLIKVTNDRLGSTEEVSIAEGQTAVYSSRVRTLVDAVYDWARFNSLPRGYEWIRGEMSAKRISVEALLKDTLRYGDIGTIRRIGAFLEREKVNNTWLMKLERALRPTSSFIPLIPTIPKRGPISRRWGVVLNEPT